MSWPRLPSEWELEYSTASVLAQQGIKIVASQFFFAARVRFEGEHPDKVGIVSNTLEHIEVRVKIRPPDEAGLR